MVEWISKVERVLIARSDALVAAVAKDAGYSLDDARALVLAALTFLKGLNGGRFGERSRVLLSAGSSSHRVPWGKVLIVIPNNAVAPLAVILPVAFALAGNTVAFAGGRSSGESLGVVSQIFEGAGAPIRFEKEGARAAVDLALGLDPVDLLYVVGSSSMYPSLAQRAAERGVDLIFEGEGGGSLVVDKGSPCHLRAAVDALISAKLRWRGQMCSAPLAVFVNSEVLNEFERIVSDACLTSDWGEQAPVLLSAEAQAALSRVSEVLPGARRDWSQPLSRVHAIGPVGATEIFSTEIFGPVFLYESWSEVDGLKRQLSMSRFGLQLTVFSEDEHLIHQLIGSARVARVCLNMQPTNQDPLLPWGGYRRSGRSEVVSFLDKAYRSVLIESW
ncbi:MAG: aldehyde dehydrogenase family protein [Lysobacterales bacterium]